MHEDTLNRYADLTGMVVAALHQRLDDRVDLDRTIDDDGCRAAMLERAAGARCQLRAQVPSDLCRADEAQERDARMSDEGFGQGVVLGDQKLTPGGRQPCLMDEFDEPPAAER